MLDLNLFQNILIFSFFFLQILYRYLEVRFLLNVNSSVNLNNSKIGTIVGIDYE